MSDTAVMSFREHLAELRTRLIRVAAILAVGFFVCWSWRIELFGLLSGPIARALADNGVYHFQAIEITESIMVYIKTSLVAAAVLTSPLTFWQLWSFISPGLLDNERRFIVPVTFFTVIFFLIGCAFAYEVILPFITDWLVKLTLEGGQADVVVTLQNAYSTSIVFLLIFGLTFELPLVIFFLALFGIVNYRSLLRFFRYFVVLSFVIGAILTPPDPMSQVLMAVPLNVLYAFGILVAWGVDRSRGEDGRATAVGATVTRIFGASLLLVGLAAALVVVFIRSLPEKELSSLLPAEITWFVGANPAIIEENRLLLPDLRDQLGGSPWLAALGAAGLSVADVHDAALAGTSTGSRVLLVRADGLGLRVATLGQGLPEGSLATRVDEDTVAIGDAALAESVAAVARGDVDGERPDDDEARLLVALRGSGPVWAWLPEPGAHASALLAGGIGSEITAAGGWLRGGENARISLVFHAPDRALADELETHLDVLRSQGPATAESPREAALAQALAALAREVKPLVAPERRAGVEALEAQVTALHPKQPTFQLPGLTALGTRATGWALRRQDLRVSLTADLDQESLRSLLQPLGRALTSGALAPSDAP
ncbi:MAG: twin-arginine translocase subunit TatC [Deltaproteobacteria bacterium]|nr:twin-arginine translocase subunit TatC [Deltaproteobacteria bacterium]MCB9788368.1 twin-arginine translocase subunit TatC [Deltaproteobacteria bacterium]